LVYVLYTSILVESRVKFIYLPLSAIENVQLYFLRVMYMIYEQINK